MVILSVVPSVQSLSQVWLFATGWTAALQASLSITNCQSLLKLICIESVMPSNHLILSFTSPPALILSQHQGLFKRVSTSKGGQCIGVSTSASVHLVNIQDWFPLGLTGWIFLQTKGLQESSPTPQFKSINSLALSFLYSPTLTSMHDYWENHSLD